MCVRRWLRVPCLLDWWTYQRHCASAGAKVNTAKALQHVLRNVMAASPQCFDMPETDFPFCSAARVAITASSLPGAGVTWEMVSRPGNRFQTDFSYVAGVSDAITPSNLARAVNTRESMSRSGTETTSSTSVALVGVFQDGQSSRSVSFLVSRQGTSRRVLGNCDHDVLPVMPPAIQGSGGRIALTCVWFYLIWFFTYFLRSHIQAIGYCLDGVPRVPLNFDGDNCCSRLPDLEKMSSLGDGFLYVHGNDFSETSQTDLFVRYGCERCYHCLQSSACCLHSGDRVPFGHGNEPHDGCRVCGCFEMASQVRRTCRCVSECVQS